MRILSAYVPESLAEEVEALAAQLNRTRSWVVRELVKFGMDNRITFLNNQRIDIPPADEGAE